MLFFGLLMQKTVLVVDGDCCDICGDAGVIDAIVTCTRCKIFCEHLYCMRICRVDYPEDWHCEACKRKDEKASPNSGTREEFNKVSVGSTSKKLQHDSSPSNKHHYNPRQNLMDQRKKIISGRTKRLSTEEVIMLASGAKTCGSPVKLNIRSSSVSQKNTATIYNKTPIKSTAIVSKSSAHLDRADLALGPAPSKSSVHLVGANPALAPVPSKHFKPLRPANSQTSEVAQRQVPQSVKGLRGNNVNEVPLKDHMPKEEKLNQANLRDQTQKSKNIIRTPLKKHLLKEQCKDACGDTAEIRLKKAKCEAGFASSPSIHGQQIVSSGLQRTGRSVCSFAHPSSDVSWNGSFEVSNAPKRVEISYLIQAYPPSRVLRKVYEFSKLMPEVLQFELVPRGNLWVDLFQQFCLDKRDIGLYFFPGNRERWENYVSLLEFMEAEDLAMRARIDGMELLIFTSKLLSWECQKWKGRNFLWGVFKKISKSASLVNAQEYHVELDSNVVDMDIDMIGGEDVVGRKDIVVLRESPQPRLPDVTMDMERDAMGGKDVGKIDIIFSKESLRLPASRVTAVMCDEIPPGFENTCDQRLKKCCSSMANTRTQCCKRDLRDCTHE